MAAIHYGLGFCNEWDDIIRSNHVVALVVLMMCGCVESPRSGVDSDSMGSGGHNDEQTSGVSPDASTNVSVDEHIDLRDAFEWATDAGRLSADGGERVNDDDVVTRPPAPLHLGGERPANYFLPYEYDPAVSMPVLIGLHGYTGSALWHNSYLGLSEFTQQEGILLIMPDGRRNPEGHRFWSATDFCCDRYDQGDIDTDYLVELIDEAARHFNIDERRIAFFGHSNGGFMSYRMACEFSDRLTHVISLAGTTWFDSTQCPGAEPVSVLHIHGTLDPTVRYHGQVRRAGDPQADFDILGCQNEYCAEESIACNLADGCSEIWACMTRCGWGPDRALCRQGCYNISALSAQEEWTSQWFCMLNEGCFDDPREPQPGYASAEDTVAHWVRSNGCSTEPQEAPPMDLVLNLPGVDTVVLSWRDACQRSTEGHLWRIEKGDHLPGYNRDFTASALSWFLSTPRDD